MENIGEHVDSRMKNQILVLDQKIEKRLTLQQNCIWGMLALLTLLVFILLVKLLGI